MATKTYKANERVALAEKPSIRGFVYQVVASYNGQNLPEANLYQVQWDKSVVALYLAEALIPEKEAIEQEKANPVKPSEDKSVINSVISKFKKMVSKDAAR